MQNKTEATEEKFPTCPTCGEETALYIPLTGACRVFAGCRSCKLRMDSESSATMISNFEEYAIAC